MYIENINGPEDVKKLYDEKLNVLAEEIRKALLEKLSKHGGHFGPNFGMVEATIAMHAVEEKTGTKATVINPYYITGIDEALLEGLKKDHDVVITLEDGFLEGGFGEKITRFYGNSDMKVLNYGVKKELLDRYDVKELLKKNRLTVEQIVEDL